MNLSNLSLAKLPASVNAPAYARDGLTPGIVHIGCGNFHRAHMAVYLDDLFAKGESRDWALIGAGVRAGDAQMRSRLEAQDWMFTVIEVAPNVQEARVIGAMVGFVPVAEDNAPLIAAMCHPQIRIVSLTVTEGGYFIDPTTGTFDPTHPDIVQDGQTPATPRTAFGAILAALRSRKSAGLAPFTVMSCDNVPHNGCVTHDAIVGLCRLSDPEFADWIVAEVAFPNSMVDRITPATGPRERALITSLGVDDAAPVTCEPFRQWVMEDNFPTGRPAFEKVGVTFTDRVDAFEAMKIRILNGGHAILAYPAGLADIEFVHEGMADPQIRGFLEAVLSREVLPNVPPVPGVDFSDYKTLIIDRFSNSEVGDTIRRLCLDGSNRQPKFVIASLRDCLASGQDASGLMLLSAMWCRYCFGETESGTHIPPNDPDWDLLQRTSTAARKDPAVWLAMTDIYGDLGSNQGLVDQFTKALNGIWANGSRAEISAYLSSSLSVAP
jgi:mannitol 2-dehydrogenase